MKLFLYLQSGVPLLFDPKEHLRIIGTKLK